MVKCEACGVEIENDDVYELKGKKVCEDCALEGSALNSPSKPCG